MNLNLWIEEEHLGSNFSLTKKHFLTSDNLMHKKLKNIEKL